MMRLGWLLLLLFLPRWAWGEPGGVKVATSSTSTLAARPQPPAPPPPAQSPPAPPKVRDPAWSLYQRAFLALAGADQSSSEALLEQLIAEHGSHPAGLSAARVLNLLRRGTQPALLGEAVDNGLRDGPATDISRAEVVVFQTIHGIVAGVEVCAAIECNGAQPVGGAMLLGGAAGLGASLFFTRNGISPGLAAAIDAGTIWGGLLTMNFVSATSDDVDTAGFMGILTGQVLGLAIGAGAWKLTGASAGDVSLTSSGGLWTGYLGALIALATSTDAPQGNKIPATLFTTGALGLGLGALAAHYVPMSRSRVLIIDGGGLVGTLVGLTVSLLGTIDSNAAFVPPAIGAVVGLGLTAALTRGFDAPDLPPLAFWAMPTENGVVGGLGGRF